MGKEQASVAQGFTLTPTKIFSSRVGYALNDYGIACQAILVHQHAIIADNPNPEIVEGLNKQIVKICEKHNIPEDAIPLLKSEFDCAVEQQRKITMQEPIPNAQARMLAKI